MQTTKDDMHVFTTVNVAVTITLTVFFAVFCSATAIFCVIKRVAKPKDQSVLIGVQKLDDQDSCSSHTNSLLNVEDKINDNHSDEHETVHIEIRTNDVRSSEIRCQRMQSNISLPCKDNSSEIKLDMEDTESKFIKNETLKKGIFVRHKVGNDDYLTLHKLKGPKEGSENIQSIQTQNHDREASMDISVADSGIVIAETHSMMS